MELIEQLSSYLGSYKLLQLKLWLPFYEIFSRPTSWIRLEVIKPLVECRQMKCSSHTNLPKLSSGPLGGTTTCG